MREDTITDLTDPAIRTPNNPPLRSHESNNTFMFLLRCNPVCMAKKVEILGIDI
ncbi:uncharacterized protein RSE6_04879 [Rhynchosporium secalis]|uniref:Uncharacterized protein n=1 Tax=Rhynchosporium secalis TaxID=38038 RepID=A0A1E1M6F0_RHYSE|nr:uncharacterized protein RSE6_04879 [Rhynchosporium secalis]